MITLHFNNTTLKIYEDDSSYRHRALGEKTTLTLKFSLPEFIEIPVGAWCEYQGETFTLNKAENFKKNNTRDLEYTLILGDPSELLGEYKLSNPVDRRLKWSMCATPREFVQVIVDNLNQRAGGGWSVGDCIEASEKTIEFNHVYCDAALSTVANDFKTEFEIIGKQISLHKVEYFKNDPLPLGYGKGNGFKPGVGRTTQSDQKPIKRLYVQGGERNIDRSKYGSGELLLPKGQTFNYEGKVYKSDIDGYYIERVTPESSARKEDSLDLSEIYPSRVGDVTSVVVVDEAKNWFDFIDNTIPQDLNFNDYIIAGETPVIIFQSGMLAGNDRQFEFKYDHETRRFELKPQEIDGVTMPNNTFKPVAGDKYAIFGIMLPEEYICNNPTQSGASWNMFREAVRYLSENEETKFTFSGELQSVFTKKNWIRIGGRLKVGSYILFTDEQFAKDGMLIRIVGIKDYTSSPYTPIITISNEARGVDVNSKLNEIGQNEIKIDESHEDAIRYTKRRFRDAVETMQMLEQSLLDNFTDSINPIAVHTMQMLVGDESLQFRFVTSKTNLTAIPYNINYDNITKKLTCPHGYLQHMTLGIHTLASSHEASEYLVWEMSQYESPELTDLSKNYYLYARVHRTNTALNGSFLLSHTAIGMKQEANYYYLLVGVLNKEYDGERSFVTLYGFTEVLPGRISTDKIVSSNGLSYFDLANNEFNLGGLFSLNNDKGLWLKSKMILGDTDASGQIRVWAGHNGLYTNPKSIASFWGGNMVDRYFDENGNIRTTPLTSGFAASVMRMDGSLYLGGGAHAFNADGSGWLGGEDKIKFNADGSMVLGSGIKINLNTGEAGLKETIESFANLLTYFIPEKADGTPADWSAGANVIDRIRVSKNFYSTGGISAYGKGTSGGGGAGASGTLGSLLNVVPEADDAPTVDKVLVRLKDSTHWTLKNLSEVVGLDKVALSTYLTTNNYAKKSDIPSLADYVTLDTAQSITGRKTFVGGLNIRFNGDSSNAIPINWMATDGTTVKQSIVAHNTAQRLILNPCGASSAYDDAVGKYSLIVGVNELKYNTQTILHAANYSAYALPLSGGTMANTNLVSNLNADLLDGVHGSEYLMQDREYGCGANNSMRWINGAVDSKTMGGLTTAQATFVSFGNTTHGHKAQLLLGKNTYKVRACYGNTDNSDWKDFAFLDSNVASASKLQTPRSLWGNDFNGEQPIGGDITFDAGDNGRKLSVRTSGEIHFQGAVSGWAWGLRSFGNNDSTDLGYAAGSYGSGNTLNWHFYGGTHNFPSMVILPSGNIGIGTTSPAYKLDVNGTTRTTTLKIGNITLSEVNGNLEIAGNVYSTGGMSAYGNGTGGSGTGGGALWGLMTAWDASQATAANALGANLGYELHTRLQNVYGKSTIDAMLANYADKTWVENKGYLTASSIANVVKVIPTNGVAEIGRYIDFHSANWLSNTSEDFTVRLDGGAASNGSVFTFPTAGGVLATESFVTGQGYAHASALSGYLPLAGGTMTGILTMSNTSDSTIKVQMKQNGGHAPGLHYFDTNGRIAGIGYFANMANGEATPNHLYIGWGSSPWNVANCLAVADDKLTYKNNAIWHAGNDGTGSGLDADMLDGWHRDEVRTRVLGFERVTGSASYGGYDLNTLLQNGGMTSQYGAYGYWANAPAGMGYGSVVCFKPDNYTALYGMLAWDINHNNATDITRKLYWRAYSGASSGEYTGWGKWHQIAFTDSNVASASKLSDNTTFKAWGQTFFENGVPKNVNGQLTLPYTGSTWATIAENASIQTATPHQNGVRHGLARITSKQGDVVVFGGHDNTVGFFGWAEPSASSGFGSPDWQTAWNTADGLLTHTSNMSVWGTLGVSGALTAHSTLTVHGVVTTSSNVSVGNALSVQGVATFNNVLRIGGADGIQLICQTEADGSKSLKITGNVLATGGVTAYK